MAPYYNQNNNGLMISYVVPLYRENWFIGVVVMDFDYTVLTDIVHKIKIYENGYAHLELNDEIIHGSDNSADEIGSQNSSDGYFKVSEILVNGMTLVISADYDDIRRIRYEIGFEILFIVLLFSSLFSLLVIFMVRRIVNPIKKLTDASVKLSNGDYDAKIEYSSIRELNLLSSAFENMIVSLREYKDLQHRLAHRDMLTGLRNTTSYNCWINEFDAKIKEGGVSFGVAVLDINDLKGTNDTHGHILGNELIVTASKIICDTFKKSPVFRIGGDEFCVILQNSDFEDVKALFERFDAKCAAAYVDKENVKFPVSIAKGFAEFDPQNDTRFSDVFERADSEMYKNKRLMKEREI
jgi:diguanylate cyclase (GGDEF)-like protein